MCEMTGYSPKTTFWMDFTIAEKFGINEIKDTYERCLTEWKHNYIYLTELVMVLNWKIWYWYDKELSVANSYNKFFEKADQYAIKNLKDEELKYFLNTVD